MLPGVMVTTCGSYRRGNSASGDVDILISNPNGDCPILNKLVEQYAFVSKLRQFSCLCSAWVLRRLHDDGLLVADLNHPGEHVAASSSKVLVVVFCVFSCVAPLNAWFCCRLDT